MKKYKDYTIEAVGPEGIPTLVEAHKPIERLEKKLEDTPKEKEKQVEIPQKYYTEPFGPSGYGCWKNSQSLKKQYLLV